MFRIGRCLVWHPGLPRCMSLLLVLAGLGCASDVAPLANMNATPQEVVEAALAALEVEDGDALRGLLVTREEFEEFIWPVLLDRANTQLEFFWGTMAMNSRKGVRQLENNYGGLSMDVVSIEMPPRETLESYPDFTFHVGVKVTVRRRDTGETGVLPSFDGFLQYGEGWKLLNFDEL